MQKTVFYFAAASTLAISATGAQAQTAEDWAAMQAELRALRGEVQALRAQVEQQNGVIAEARTESEARDTQQDQQIAAQQAATPAAVANAPAVKWKGAPEISGADGWSFKPRGRLQYDFAHIGRPGNFPDDGLGFSNELRRGRLGAQGTMPGGFGYKVELEFADNEVEFTDAYFSYSAGPLELIAGQHNNFQSLDELTSSLDYSFMERAAFTDAFGFERKVGLSAQYAAGDLLGQAGVFTANIDDLTDDENDTVGLSGRLVYMPKIGDATRLHLAANAQWTDFGDSSNSVRYRQRPFLHSSDTRFIDTGTLRASSEMGYGLEGAVISGPFHAAAEAHWQKANLIGVGSDAGFFGGYGEVGYFLTGETRGYGGGLFKGPKVAKPVGGGGTGAFQIVARYDYLDLDDTDLAIFGGKQNGYELGISWWPIDYIRIMANYGRIEYDNAVPTPAGETDYGIDVFGGRFQVGF